jgi:hypothetical protein
MTLWFIGGLFALALVDLLMRRRRGETEAASVVSEHSKDDEDLFFLLRPLVPGYRFFDRIETRLELRLRTLDAADGAGPWLPAPAPPKRPWYFWWHNPHENLWLAEQAALPAVLEDEPKQKGAFALLSARCALQLSHGQRFQFAIVSTDESENPVLFVSPILEAKA